MERPRSMMWFDRIFAVLLILVTINAALRWHMAVNVIHRDSQAMSLLQGNADVLVFAMFALVMAVMVLIWWLASRRRSRIAAVLLASIFLVMAVVGIRNFTTQSYSWQLTMWSSAAQICAYLAGVVVLLLPSTRHWFTRRSATRQLEETFS
jgi:hypothetical protein